VGEIGTGWVAEPEHWSALTPGRVLELGKGLVMVTATGAHEGRRWLQVLDGATGQPDNLWADIPDPLAMVLVRRDVLAGQVIHDG